MGAAYSPPACNGPAPMLTEVDLVWVEHHSERWIRFGRFAGEWIVDRRRRVLSFAPGAVFALVRWAGNDYGTALSRIDIACAVAPGAGYTTLAGVRPGATSLLAIRGWPKVRRVLAAIDAVEAAGVDAADAAPDHWRHVHNRIVAGLAPRSYAPPRHCAWLRRRELAS